MRKALLFGINYVNTAYELAGCINDVRSVRDEIQRRFPQCTIEMVTDATTLKPTKSVLLSQLALLVGDLQPGENVLFHYSGHGGLVVDRSGDEASGMDSCIYPVSGRTLQTVTDDEIRAALANRIPSGCKCFVVLDACHSGTAVDLKYTHETRSTRQSGLTSTANDRYADTAGTVVFLSGCRDPQTSADTVDQRGRPCGALTWALTSTWNSYGARSTSFPLQYLLWDIRAFLRSRNYSQVPVLSTGTPIEDNNTTFDLAS